MSFKFRPSAVVCLLLLLLSWIRTGQAQNGTERSGDLSNAARPVTKVPSGVILVKGAWSASSDSSTPLPEGGTLINGVFENAYFGLRYALPKNWVEEYKGPPPSDSGRYVLAQLQADERSEAAHILITAQDTFFSQSPASDAIELAAYEKDNLQSDYKLQRPITQTKIAGRLFTFFAYESPVAQLHWYVLGTDIRCHTLEFVITGRDPNLLENLMLAMNRMELSAGASPAASRGASVFPVCIKGYAETDQLIRRADPVFTEHRFNPVPVRIIIDREGKIKHIHFLSAFPDQEQAIGDALRRWKFKPYLSHGHPVEVETGVMFGHGKDIGPDHETSPAVD